MIDAVVAGQAGKTVELPVELPRQSGKTTVIVDVVCFLSVCSLTYFGRPIAIGVFAPQVEQATTDFDRTKTQATMLAPLGLRARSATKRSKEQLAIPEKWNSKTVRLFNKLGLLLCEIYIFPLAKNSNPESKTLDLEIIEEAQDVNDEKMKQAVFPMVASTNGPRVYIGTAGNRICYFYRELQDNPAAIKVEVADVFKQRREVYESTKEPRHLLYETFVSNEIKKHGLESDYIQIEYMGKWRIGSGMFCTEDQLEALVEKGRGIIQENKERVAKVEGDRRRKEERKEAYPCFVGIDHAKSMDATVVTVLRDNTDLGRPQLCGWLRIRGDNYEDQFDQIVDYLKAFENIHSISIDSTGQGSFMPDKFERNTSYQIRPITFTLKSKDTMYTNLRQVVKNLGTALPDLPADDPLYREFRREMLDLQVKFKGRYMTCEHPDGTDNDGQPFHDDYPDSWALAEDGYAEYKKNQPVVSFV